MKDVPSFHVTVTVVGMRVYPEGDGSTFSERKGYCISYVPVKDLDHIKDRLFVGCFSLEFN